MEYGQNGGLRSPDAPGADGFKPPYVFTPRLVGRLACGELAVEPVLGPARVVDLKPGGRGGTEDHVFIDWHDEHGPGTAAGTYTADRSFDVRMPAHTDRLIIRQGIDRARWQRREITGETARLIAGHLHLGRRSALHGFMTDGRINERLYDELDMVGKQRLYARDWVDALVRHCLAREDTGALPAWNRRAVSEGEARAEAWLGAAGINVSELERQVNGNGHDNSFPDLLAREQMSTEMAMQLIEAAFGLGMEASLTSRVARTAWADQQQAMHRMA